MKCEKIRCIANLDGECVFDRCKGELVQISPCRVKDKEARKKYYDCVRETFDKDFPHTGIRELMRSDGVCEEDIEMALSTIEELRRATMAEYIERSEVIELLKGLRVKGGVDLFDGGYNRALEDIAESIEDVEEFPAADVRSERHGCWIVGERNRVGFIQIECSECGFAIATSSDPCEWIGDENHQFCGRCGAKMNGKGGDTN